MSALRTTRGVQTPLMAEFTFDVSTAVADTMPTVVGNVIAGATPAYNAAGVSIGMVAANIFEVINLPPGATVTGGEIVVETAVAGPTASTISVGDSLNATRYASAVDLKTAARTAITPTGYRGSGENIRITVTNTVAIATAGKVTLRLFYVVLGRICEVQAQ